MWLICCLHLFPQDAEQQQHQQTVCGQFQPHAKAQDLVSGVTEGGTMSPVCARLCYWSIDWLNVTTFTFSSGVSCYTLNNITFNYRLFSLPLCLFLFIFFPPPPLFPKSPALQQPALWLSRGLAVRVVAATPPPGLIYAVHGPSAPEGA